MNISDTVTQVTRSYREARKPVFFISLQVKAMSRDKTSVELPTSHFRHVPPDLPLLI